MKGKGGAEHWVKVGLSVSQSATSPPRHTAAILYVLAAKKWQVEFPDFHFQNNYFQCFPPKMLIIPYCKHFGLWWRSSFFLLSQPIFALILISGDVENRVIGLYLFYCSCYIYLKQVRVLILFKVSEDNHFPSHTYNQSKSNYLFIY